MSNQPSILIVDDDANLRETLSMILTRAGYAVTKAASGKEALQYLQAGGFNLVFLDLRMPDMDGLSVLHNLRQWYSDMPVILLTAFATIESAIEAMRNGANDYLLKPLDPPLILERVANVLQDYRQPKRRREIYHEIQHLLAELNGFEASPQPDVPGNGAAADKTTVDPARYLQRGPLILDLHSQHASLSGRTLELSPTAFDYLVTLVRHSPDVVSYQTLVAESQGYKPNLFEAQENARWRIHELRRVIEEDSRHPHYIITVRGQGYRLVV